MEKTLAERLLLDGTEVQLALGFDVQLEPSRQSAPVQALGDVIAKAAREAAYRSFSGTLEGDDSNWPLAVGEMALVFDVATTSVRTFDLVAEAAHMRTVIGGCNVAVETAASANGLVSYWGYLQLADRLVVVTLDTIDPQAVSMTHFRGLVTAAARRLETAGSDSVHS